MGDPAAKRYIPALGYRWLTPAFDPFLRLVLRERAWKPCFVARIAPRPGERILDLGCGTGTLALMIEAACPEAEVVGLDADPDVLAIAAAKAHKAGAAARFVRGYADDPRIRRRSSRVASTR